MLINHRKDRRNSFEKCKALERNGKKPNKQLARISEEFEAIDSVLRHELPILQNLVTELMSILLVYLMLAQAQWFSKWKTMFQSLSGKSIIPRLADIVADFHRDFGDVDEDFEDLGIIGSSHPRRILGIGSSHRTRRAHPVLLPSSRPVPPDNRTSHAAGQNENDLGSSEGSRRSLHSAFSGNDDGPRPSTSWRDYDVLWKAASLFEFNMETTKREAGYPYLLYSVGEVFDVIAERGELWLAVNQDDPNQEVGWIWDKHFAQLQDHMIDRDLEI